MNFRLKMLQKLAQNTENPMDTVNNIALPMPKEEHEEEFEKIKIPEYPAEDPQQHQVQHLDKITELINALREHNQPNKNLLMEYWNTVYPTVKNSPRSLNNIVRDFFTLFNTNRDQAIDWNKIIDQVLLSKIDGVIDYFKELLVYNKIPFDNDIFIKYENTYYDNDTKYSFLKNFQERVEFLKNNLVSSDYYNDFLKNIDYNDHHDEIKPADLYKIIKTQNNFSYQYISQLPFVLFFKTSNPDWLKLSAILPLPSLTPIISEHIDKTEQMKVIFNMFPNIVNSDFILKTFQGLSKHSNTTEALQNYLVLFEFAKGRVNRITILELLTPNYTFSFTLVENYLSELDEAELEELSKKAFSWENSNKIIIRLSSMPSVNKDELTKAVIANKNYDVALSLIKTGEKGSFDIVILQKFIETSGDIRMISRLLGDEGARNNKFNFAQGKKKYNEIFNKNQKAVDERVDFITKSLFYLHDPDAKSFLDEAISKKDWYYADVQLIRYLFDFDYGHLRPYLRAKNKQGRDIYHELKNDNGLYLSFNNSVNGDYGRELNYLFGDEEILNGVLAASTNFAQYIKFLARMANVAELVHNFSLSKELSYLLILNTSVDPGDPSTGEFFETYNSLEKEHENVYLSQAEEIAKAQPGFLDINSFQNNLNVFKNFKERFENKQSITMSKGSVEYQAVKTLHVQLNMIINFETVREYIDQAKPKDKDLFKLNWTHPLGFDFSVLKDLDPYVFQIGADTECCQRMGGAGEDAAIDSFINPFAGVLVCKYDGSLISQSYFHWVPEQKGIILDNVEVNNRNLSHLKLDSSSLSKIYADFAAAMKQKYPEISYVKCGKDYNKLDNSLFAQSKMKEDPRHFESEEQYSDFDENNHLNLLEPTDRLKHVSLPDMSHLKQAEVIVPLLKIAMVRNIYFSYVKKSFS